MARELFKTEKGTELPLMNLRGKEYLQVMHRLVWFREEVPNGSIETEMVVQGEDECTFRAVISVDGKVLATGHKSENKKSFKDFVEKAETGAIGRALAMCGYGTQFTADELDEVARS